VLAVVAALGVVLTSAYLLQLVRGLLQGAPPTVEPVNEGVASVELATTEVDPGTAMAGAVREDVDAAEWVTWSPLVVLVVVLGIAPALLLSPAGEAARSFLGALGGGQ
jgi:NADH-quinone oxidoreductase subunit M